VKPSWPARWVVPLPLAGFWGVALALSASTASAKPEFSRREGKACAYCHVNARGGGDRNAKGMEYERNGFKFPDAKKGYGEDDLFATPANGTAFYYVREAIELGHYADALARLKVLQGKEKKGAAAQRILNTYGQVDQRGRDLVKAARDAVANGQVKEAAEALARVEVAFRGREPAKDVPKVRAELLKLPGGKEAEAAAKAAEPQRVQWLTALMEEVQGDVPGAKKLLEDLLAKHPQGPFAAQAKEKLEALAEGATGG
jgi:hypothetical protein